LSYALPKGKETQVEISMMIVLVAALVTMVFFLVLGRGCGATGHP
jgi:hypothetical protein